MLIRSTHIIMIMIIFGKANIGSPSSQYDVAVIRLDEGDSYYVKLILVLLQGLYRHYCMYVYLCRSSKHVPTYIITHDIDIEYFHPYGNNTTQTLDEALQG